jgi:RNA processing factor Prp31
MSSADDVKMSENPVPETLETIAAKIDALSKSIDRRFDAFSKSIDRRFDAFSKSTDRRFDAFSKSIDRRFEESGAQLGVKIEALATKVTQVYDEVIAMREESKRNASEHKTFTKGLDNHDVRILALEKPGSPKL